MMKKISIILAILGLTLFCGCISSSKETRTNTAFSSSFNQQTYVWESLYFPTNRVMDRK